MITPATARTPSEPYLALPPGGAGPGVLVLHAWWGLNGTFRAVCDRLAAAGFVALAPDLYGGVTAATIEEAEALMTAASRDFVGTRTLVEGAVAALRGHPGVRGDAVGAVGFSMGAYWAMLLATEQPANLAAAVAFYGSGEGDFGRARAAFLGHYAEGDEWEPDEQVRQLEEEIRAAGREVVFHRYPGAKHWFCEPDRPEYAAAAATLAWERTLTFLRRHLPHA